MKKRSSFLGLFVIGILLMMGLVGTLTGISADEDGSVALDEAWYTLGATATVTVTDADEDVALDQTQIIGDSGLLGGGRLTALGAFDSTSFALLNPPLVGTPDLFLGAGGVKGAAIVSTELVIIAQTNATGYIAIQAGANGFTGGDLFVEYGQGIADTVNITVTSTSSKTGITVTADEVDDDSVAAVGTGIFERVINLVEGGDDVSSSTTFTLGVRNGDTITVEYTDANDVAGNETDRKVTAKVETNVTIITNVFPSNETSTQLRRPDFSASLSDTESGVDDDNIYILVDADDDATITGVGSLLPEIIVGTPNVNYIPTLLAAGTVTAGDLEAIVTANGLGREVFAPDDTTGSGTVVDIDFVPPRDIPFGAGGATEVNDAEHDLEWLVVVYDVAGNVTFSDSDPDSENDLGLDGAVGGGDDGAQLGGVAEPHIIRVDSVGPAIVCGACEYRTGEKWDAEDEEIDSNKRSWIRIIASEKLDPNSVSAADFLVDGLTPLSATVFPDQQDEAGALPSIFVEMASDLDYDATPEIDLSINARFADVAGNVTTNALHATIDDDAVDRIDPSFTVTISGGSGGDDLTKGDIDIDITATEPIAGNLPTVQLFNEAATLIRALGGVQPTGKPNEWEITFTATGADPDGDISVVVNGTDQNGNLGGEGENNPDDPDANVFELDTTDPTATFIPVSGVEDFDTEVDDTSPVITATYTEDVTVVEALFEEEGGSETDVTDQMFSSDDEKWVYAARDLAIDGEYTFTITVVDDAGNEGDAQDTTFTVVERELVEVALNSGNNLISLPSTPADGDINNVGFPDGVSSIITYDPFAVGGPWLVATRGAEGDFSGSLTTIDAGHAYWVESSSFAPIEVDIPAQDFNALVDSAIPIVAGWNLVPVRSLTDQQPDNDPDAICGAGVGTGVAGCLQADRYFGSVNWITAYTFVTQGKTWVKLLPDQLPADTVGIGKGYWLYAAQAGTLVP